MTDNITKTNVEAVDKIAAAWFGCTDEPYRVMGSITRHVHGSTAINSYRLHDMNGAVRIVLDGPKGSLFGEITDGFDNPAHIEQQITNMWIEKVQS